MAVERFIPGRTEEFSDLIPQWLAAEDREGDMLCYGLVLRAGEAGTCVIAPRGRKAVLRWILIREDLQKQGLGSDFLLDVLLRLKEEGYTTLSMQMLPSEAPGIVRLAEKFHAEKLETDKTWYVMKLSEAEKLGKIKGDRKETFSLRSVTKEDRAIVRERINMDFPELANRPFSLADLEQDLTILKFDDEGACAGLFVEEREGGLYLAYLFNDTDEPTVVEGLLSQAYEKAKEKYPGKTLLSIASLDERTSDLLSGISAAEKEEMVEYSLDLSFLDGLTEEDDIEA